jgi:hypothetical protein
MREIRRSPKLESALSIEGASGFSGIKDSVVLSEYFVDLVDIIIPLDFSRSKIRPPLWIFEIALGKN